MWLADTVMFPYVWIMQWSTHRGS